MQKLPFTLLGAFTTCLPLMGETVTTTLTVEPDGDFNVIELSLDPPILGADDDETDLEGTLEVEMDIDPTTDEVSTFTILNGTATGSPINLSASTLFVGNYDFSSSELGAELSTPFPPGQVDPATGEFPATDHAVTVNRGTLSGDISIPVLGVNEDVNFDFAAEPFSGTGAGTGTITLTPTSETAEAKEYDVVVLLPVAIDDMIDAMGFSVDISAEGTMKAVGSVSVPLGPSDPFLTWTEENGIAGASFDGDENGDDVPDGLHWALGLELTASPYPALPQPMGSTDETVDFTITLPETGSASEITVLTSADPSTLPFEPLAPGAVSAGNPIPAGTSGTITICLPKERSGYLQLSVTAPEG